MTSLADKLPVKDFNAIFKNDELAKEISQLIEKANSRKSKIEYRYSKEELLEISKNPICKIPKAIFNARLAKSNLSDNIIYSLQRKDSLDKNQNNSDSLENINSDFFDESGQNFNRYKNNVRNNVKNRENLDGYRENVNQRFDREKNYRSNKVLDSESAQCWRTDKNQPNNRNKPYQDRYVQPPRKYNERYNNRNSYNRNGYRDDYEEEPEWFSNGPESMNEFIDLKGFDDDENCPSDNCSQELTDKRDSSGFCARNSGDMLDKSKNESKNESFNHNLSDISSMLNMDVSKLFNSPNASLFENMNDIPLSMFGDLNSSNSSSRAQKWFKNKNESISLEDSYHNTSKSTSPITVGSDKSNILNQLFNQQAQLNSLSSSQANLADIKFDMSKATNLAELEASMLNTAPAKKNENGSFQDSAVLSKILSMAGQQETKSNIPSDSPLLNSPPFNLHNNFVNDSYNKHLNPPNAAPNSVPMFTDMNQLANHNMNRMVHPSLLKETSPMPPFPFSQNNMPFNMDSIHQRPPGHFFPPPIPPEMAHPFFPPNAFLPPGFMPNGPFPPPMMMNPGQMPPPLAAQLIAQYNAMMQNSLMTQDIAKSKSDESNLTDKLLKNSKFTPTSVFRKLNDQNKTKLSTTKIDQHSLLHAKSEMDLLNASAKLNDPFEIKEHRQVNDISNVRAPNTIPHPLSNYNQPINDKNASDMAFLLQQLNLNRAPNQPSADTKPNAFSLNPNDIFSAMKKSEHNAANIGLPPLPTKNAFKLEDLENF